MNFLLAITENDYGTENLLQSFGFGEVVGFGAQMLLIGMATVFAVLCIIWLCLVIFKYAFQNLGKGKKDRKTEAEVVQPVNVAAPSASADTEIVAVIAAAIAMAESESSDTKFRVVSFRRK